MQLIPDPIEFKVLLEQHKPINIEPAEHNAFNKADYKSFLSELRNTDWGSLFENLNVELCIQKF